MSKLIYLDDLLKTMPDVEKTTADNILMAYLDFRLGASDKYCRICNKQLSASEIRNYSPYDFNYTCKLHNDYAGVLNFHVIRKKLGVDFLQRNAFLSAVFSFEKYLTISLLNKISKMDAYDIVKAYDDFCLAREECYCVMCDKELDISDELYYNLSKQKTGRDFNHKTCKDHVDHARVLQIDVARKQLGFPPMRRFQE